MIKIVGALSILLPLVLGACTPTAPARDTPQAGQPQAPKTMTLAVPRELDTWNTDLTLVTRGGGVSTIQYIGHNKLVVQQSDTLAYAPELAAEQLSLERGTWRLNPDGTMDTTWKIRSNVKWHDGAPFTADDLLFTFTVIKDPAIPNVIGAPQRLMRSAAAPDPYTFAIHWSAPYIDADQAPGLTIMPRHLLEDAYQTDKANFVNHPWMTTDFVGLGPYRLAKWESGVHMEFTRFDAYWKGWPAFDTVIVRFVADDNAMLANILGGHLDVIPPIGLDLDAVLQVRQLWEGTGNRVGGALSGGFKIVEMQHRSEFSRPTNGLAIRPVRQAFYHAIDRKQLAEVMTQGLGPPADSWFFPSHDLRPQLESSIPQFPYDLARAQQLLAQAGWVRGPEGALSRDGERFQVQLAGTRDDEKIVGIVADYWRSLGAQVEEFPIGTDRARDLEGLAWLPGGWVTTPRYYQMYTDRFHSKSAPTAATRWTGRNRGGYSNPTVDGLLDRLVTTIPPAERLPLHRELLREQVGDLTVMPLYWEYDAYLVVRGVSGVRGSGWNIFEWNKE